MEQVNGKFEAPYKPLLHLKIARYYPESLNIIGLQFSGIIINLSLSSYTRIIKTLKRLQY